MSRTKSRIAAGDILTMVETYVFKVPVCKAYFPNGLTKNHTLIATDAESDGRVTVKVVGDFDVPGKNYGVWHNPCFRIPTYKVEVVNA